MKSGVTLILAPHTDDESMGCGGLIAKWRDVGRPLHVIAFSAAPEALPEGFHRDVTRTEFALACHILGIERPYARVFDEPVRRFPDRRQDILEEMLFLSRDLNPDTVVVPSKADAHQDHQVIYEEALRAFKQCAILGYEPSRNAVDTAFRPTLYVTLTPEQIDKKVLAIGSYNSQLKKNPDMTHAIRHMAGLRGYQIGENAAEAYEVIRWIV